MHLIMFIYSFLRKIIIQNIIIQLSVFLYNYNYY